MAKKNTERILRRRPSFGGCGCYGARYWHGDVGPFCEHHAEQRNRKLLNATHAAFFREHGDDFLTREDQRRLYAGRVH